MYSIAAYQTYMLLGATLCILTWGYFTNNKKTPFATQMENNSGASNHCHIFFWNSVCPIHVCDAAFRKMSLVQYHKLSFGK